MRCLHCHYREIGPKSDYCPRCGAYLPALLRDLLAKSTELRNGTYEIDHALGRGNFGITYHAHHHQLGRRVAIKEFYPQDYATRNLESGELQIPFNQRITYEKGLRRFIDEGRMLVHISHPAIIQAQDLFEERNTAYLVMNLIEGKTLTQLLDSCPGRCLPPEKVESLMSQLVAGLTAVHEAGIYHLDLKPDNLLITPEEKLIIIDFGSAKQAANHHASKTRCFTESYAAPELMSGGEVGIESDVFEVGMILYEMLMGQPPPSAIVRLVDGDCWTGMALEAPWRQLVDWAITLKKEERPNGLQQWWDSRFQGQKRQQWQLKPGQKSPYHLPMTLRGQFVLPDLREQGMQQRLGLGWIKSVYPLSDRLVVVFAPSGASLFDLYRQEMIWNIDCPCELGAVSPKGGYLALVWQKNIYLWSLQTGKCIYQLHGHGKNITSVIFDGGESLLFSASHDETIKIWDIKTGKEKQTLQGHNWYVTCLAINPGSNLLVSGSRDCTLRLWNIDSGDCLEVLKGHKDGVKSVVWTPNGRWVVSGGRDRHICVWDAKNATLLRSIFGHGDWITQMSISDDSKFLVTAGEINDKTIRVWSLPEAKLVRQLSGHENSVTSVAFCPDSHLVVSGGYDYSLRLWDGVSGQEISQLSKHTNWVYCLAFSPDGRLLATGGNDRILRLWDTFSGGLVRAWQGHEDCISSVAFSPDGLYLVSGSWDETVKMWDLVSGKTLRIFTGHTNFVRGVAFRPDGKSIVSGGWDRTIWVWDISFSRWSLTTGKTRKIKGHTEGVECVAFSPDGKILASGSKDKSVRLWETSSGQELHCLEGHTGYIKSLAFSPGGQSLVSASCDLTLRLWDVTTGKPYLEFYGHEGIINSVAFSPDGQWIVSGGHDLTVRLWDATSGQNVYTWYGHTHRVNCLSFNNDGSLVISGDNDGVIRIWRV
ncbi:MAG: Serine/threonine-protein kinase PknD [Chroococcopsis gigantea SAG 12.99]|nr:serine/threonine protein kinase [Chlorogloea purpurea SAG 13.99]MDV2999607.1 Serine/threonine-protein kinase PknD [Chroococcopsis gigantea SAG 12.99]